MEPSQAPKRYSWFVILVGMLAADVAAAVAFAAAMRFLGGDGSPIELASLKPTDALFYLLAGGAVVAAGGVAFARNIIYSSLALLAALLSVAGVYVYLSADFVAVTQLLIYVGGVLVLILFAVMLTQRIGEAGDSNPVIGFWPGTALLGVLLGVFGYVAVRSPWQTGKPLELVSTADKIGDLFLGPYLIAFEVISLLLLATLIGAVVVARKEIKE